MTFFISPKSELNKLFIIFFILVIHESTHAQIEQSARIETSIQKDFEAYSITSLDTAGLLLFRSYTSPSENQTEVIRLDTALQQKWKGFLPTPRTLSLKTVKYFSGRVFFFFKNILPGNQDFAVYILDINGGGYQSKVINNLIAFSSTEYIATNDAILIGGYFNFRPLVLFYNLNNEKSHILPGFLNERGEMTQIKTYSNGSIDVLVSAKNANRKKCLWIRHFDNNGNLIKTTVIEPDDNKNLIFGRMAKTETDNQIVAGVYGRNSSYSRGLFIADINEFGEYKIHYYTFADLENFFRYMKAKREKRIKDRIDRRRIKGKKTKFNYRLLVHEVVTNGDQFILLGEAFYPTYNNRSSFPNLFGGSTNYPRWGYGPIAGYNTPSYRQDNMVFDGFQYTHAVAIGFDKMGNLKWDNSFEINGIKSFRLEQFVKIVPSQNHIVLLYLFENLIRSKIIKDNNVLEGTTQNPVKTFAEHEQEKPYINGTKLEYWFSNHFYASGIQDKRDSSSTSTQKVFFINKIRVR